MLNALVLAYLGGVVPDFVELLLRTRKEAIGLVGRFPDDGLQPVRLDVAAEVLFKRADDLHQDPQLEDNEAARWWR